jgi:hypothetical protein
MKRSMSPSLFMEAACFSTCSSGHVELQKVVSDLDGGVKSMVFSLIVDMIREFNYSRAGKTQEGLGNYS